MLIEMDLPSLQTKSCHDATQFVGDMRIKAGMSLLKHGKLIRKGAVVDNKQRSEIDDMRGRQLLTKIVVKKDVKAKQNVVL